MFSQKIMFFSRFFKIFYSFQKITYYCSECNAGQKLRRQVSKCRYFEENIAVKKQVFHNIA